jgi:hypothetical protein
MPPIAGPMVPPGAGGCDFLVDPNHRADGTDVFWHPEELASVIILARAPAALAVRSFVTSEWLIALARREGDDGTHLVVRDGAVRHQLWLLTPPKRRGVMVAVMPLDGNTPHRGAATRGFWEFVARHQQATKPSRSINPGRLNAALRALDLRLEGASYRTIAEALFGSSRVADETWKTSSVRDAVIRLVRTGMFMMRGGYRRLVGFSEAD